MTTQLERMADAASVTTQPVVYGVAGMSFLGLPLQEWIVLGTALLLVFNLVFAVVKLRNIFKGEKNGD